MRGDPYIRDSYIRNPDAGDPYIRNPASPRVGKLDPGHPGSQFVYVMRLLLKRSGRDSGPFEAALKTGEMFQTYEPVRDSMVFEPLGSLSPQTLPVLHYHV